MSTQIKKNGNWVTVAGGTRMWVGTKAALQAALDAGELVDGTAVMVTDDFNDSGDQVVRGTVTDTNGFVQDGPQTSLTRCGNFVTLTISGDTSAMEAGAGLSHNVNDQSYFATIPKGFRPAGVLRVGANCYCPTDGTGALPTVVCIDPSGILTAAGPTSTSSPITWMWFTATYFTEDDWPSA